VKRSNLLSITLTDMSMDSRSESSKSMMSLLKNYPRSLLDLHFIPVICPWWLALGLGSNIMLGDIFTATVSRGQIYIFL
jgi:hypothetical protein